MNASRAREETAPHDSGTRSSRGGVVLAVAGFILFLVGFLLIVVAYAGREHGSLALAGCGLGALLVGVALVAAAAVRASARRTGACPATSGATRQAPQAEEQARR